MKYTIAFGAVRFLVGLNISLLFVSTVSCDAQANHINDVTFTAICPPGCNGTKVWGTEIYSDDSQICASAVHDGRISGAYFAFFMIA